MVMCLVVSYIIKLRYLLRCLVGRAARPDHPGVPEGDVPRGQLHHQAQVPAPLFSWTRCAA